MRLSVLMRCPLGEVLSWPDAHVRLQLAFIAREPPVEERIELGIAQLSALVFNRSRGSKEESKSLSDFLLLDDPWSVKPATVGLTPEELQMMGHLSHAKPQPA